ncbi:MAG: 50S ribosomal protein L25 [Candidatus Shapirobacteria bacterium]
MGEELNLSAWSRTDKDKAKTLRKAGYIPAIVYGSGQKNLNFKIKVIDFSKVFERAGESSLINLKIDENAPLKVVVKEVEKEPIKGHFSHIDFYKVDMKKKITVEVELEFVGESKAVAELGGVLAKAADHVEITCLPDKLINQIVVDISVLNTMNDVIKLKDLKLPEGVELEADPEDVIVSVVETVKEEIPVAPVVEAAEAAVPAEEAVAPAEEAAAPAGEKNEKTEKKKK